MKKPHLVAYDYGQGGLWAYLLAESPEDIKNRHPELVVLEEAPSWMTPGEQRKLETIDIDHVEGTWLAVPPSTTET